MQRERHNFRCQIIDDVLLRGDEFEKFNQANRLILQARQASQAIVAQGESQADFLRQQAFLAGYEEGVLIASDAVCQYMSGIAQRTEELCRQIRTDIAHTLSAFFNDEKIVLAVLKNWLDKKESDDETSFQLLMPESCKVFHRQALALIAEETSGSANIVYHKGTEFIFKFKDDIASFDPELIITEQQREKVNFDKIYQEIEGVTNEAFQMLQERISYFNVSEESSDASVVNEEITYDDD